MGADADALLAIVTLGVVVIVHTVRVSPATFAAGAVTWDRERADARRRRRCESS